MKETELKLCLKAADFWEPSEDPLTNVAPFVDDALSIERRLKKGVNQANERKRYGLCCRRIQEAAVRTWKGDDVITLEPDYFELLRWLCRTSLAPALDCRSMACFTPPYLVKNSMEGFNRLISQIDSLTGKHLSLADKRITFYEKAVQQGAGVVEIPLFLSGQSLETEHDKPVDSSAVQVSLTGRYPDEDSLTQEEGKQLLEMMLSKIEQAIEKKEPVNFSNQPHFIIAETLNAAVYKKADNIPEQDLRIIYMDGSEAEPIKVRCLKWQTDEMTVSPDLVLRASLISMRHLEVDDKVDFAWFRNRKVSEPRPFAETDEYCRLQTIELLKQLPVEKTIRIELYQTGLETAVIGFYGGLIEYAQSTGTSSSSQPWLEVVPKYYRGPQKGYETGTSWKL